MNKMVREVKEQRDIIKNKKVENFMGGVSYELNPIDTLKMVTSSSIFGEPQYYRSGQFQEGKIRDGIYKVSSIFEKYSILDDKYNDKTTSDVMEMIIDEALSYDFDATLNWAVTLRDEYMMRLNPQVIMVRAAIHKDRKKYTEEHPGKFNKINNLVMKRADEPSTQLTYYLYKNKSKKNLPSILQRSWANRLNNASKYELAKYKNKGIGIIDTVRICHANSPIIDELMQTGTIKVEDEDKTWESLRSQGKKWKDIINIINIPHMALLRNLRGIFEEIDDLDLTKNILNNLKQNVINGKQFPYRYYSAYKQIEFSEVHHKVLILDALEECMDIALDNLPNLIGKTMCLSDNSGSAWGTITSEYGSTQVAIIDNLSSILTAINSDEGYVGKFGDELKVFPISKRSGVLAQLDKISKDRDDDIGGCTEHGIWLFFRDAIDKKEHWDNIFIYSDQQAGHGGLYGVGNEYVSRNFSTIGSYIDVAKLIQEYRNKVNPKVNVFSIQTAGYNNVLIPEYGYRTNIMYGWTGKELSFADIMIKFWDEKENTDEQDN